MWHFRYFEFIVVSRLHIHILPRQRHQIAFLLSDPIIFKDVQLIFHQFWLLVSLSQWWQRFLCSIASWILWEPFKWSGLDLIWGCFMMRMMYHHLALSSPWIPLVGLIANQRAPQQIVFVMLFWRSSMGQSHLIDVAVFAGLGRLQKMCLVQLRILRLVHRPRHLLLSQYLFVYPLTKTSLLTQINDFGLLVSTHHPQVKILEWSPASKVKSGLCTFLRAVGIFELLRILSITLSALSNIDFTLNWTFILILLRTLSLVRVVDAHKISIALLMFIIGICYRPFKQMLFEFLVWMWSAIEIS